MRNSARRAALVAAGCVALGSASLVQAQHTWIGTASGNWSDPANWVAGNAPPAVGAAALTFLNKGAAVWTATNDVADPFALNNLTLQSSSSGLATIAGSGLAFGGADASITNSGVGPFTITNPVTLNSNVTLEGAGGGNTTLTGVISGPGSIVVGSALPPNNLTNIYTIGGGSNANTYTGGTVLNSGMLNLANFSGSPLGTGPVTVNGGAIGSSTGSGTASNNFILNSSLNVRASGFMYLNGVLSGPGGLNLRNQGNATQTPAALQLRGVNTYSGPTVLQQTTLHTALGGIFGNSSLSAPRLLLNEDGSILDTSSIEVQGGGALLLDNTNVAKERLGPSVPVTLKSAEMVLTGNAATFVDQRMGVITGSGFNTITINPAGAGAQISAGGLGRTLRGGFFIRGENLGSVPGPVNANVFINSPPPLVGGGGAPGSTTMSIINFVAGAPSSAALNATDLVTYGSNGVRTLLPSEYAPALGGNVLDNVRLPAATNNDADQTVNALLTEGPITGTGTIRITSGFWLSAPPAAAAQSMANNVDFGTAEGHIYIGGANASSLTINGKISGSGGLTKSGHGTMFLNNITNDFTGPVTINAGVISFADPAALGASNQIAFTYNGNVFPSFTFTGTSAVLGQDVLANSGHFRITASTANADLTLNGAISGPGGLQINASGVGAAIRLTGNNTFQQGVRIFNGDTVFSSDANLGDPIGGIDLGTGQATEGIRLEGNWTTNRPMHVSLAAGINTQTNNAILNGVISGTGAMTKVGTGALTLNGINTYTGAINIGTAVTPGGVVAVNGVTVSPINITNGILAGDGTVGAVTLNPAGFLAPGNSAGDLLATSLVWNGGGQMNFELGDPLSNHDQLDLIGAFTKGTPGAFAFNFTPLPAFEPGLYTLVTFGINNGFAVSDFAFTAPPGITGEFLLDANSLQFQAVPEPTTHLLMTAGVLALLRRRRRCDQTTRSCS